MNEHMGTIDVDSDASTLNKAGFDLTGFHSAEQFDEFLQTFGLSRTGERRENERGTPGWYWLGSRLSVRTTNNPLTGEYADPDMRDPEKGYASYIHLTGEPEEVEKAYEWILDNAAFVKDHEYGQHW